MKNLGGVVRGVLSRNHEMVQDMRKFVFGFFLAFLVLTTARGQECSGVTGVVLDNSGAAITGVDVALDKDTVNLHLKTTTNAEGTYQFPRVPPGTGYKLTFSKEGFKKLEISDVSV